MWLDFVWLGLLIFVLVGMIWEKYVYKKLNISFAFYNFGFWIIVVLAAYQLVNIIIHLIKS